MTKPYISHEEATIQSFKRDPEFAAEYLNAVLEDGTQEELMLALRRIAEAFGVKDVAEAAHLIATGTRKPKAALRERCIFCTDSSME